MIKYQQMAKAKNKKKQHKFFEKAVATWLKYDPLVKLVVGKSHRTRRDVMLNLIGPEAAVRYFGEFPPSKPQDGPIFPNIVREEVNNNIKDQAKRTKLIRKLIYWATDPNVNNRYLKSHQTRMQIVSSLLGPVFFHATAEQDQMILAGLKFMLVEKKTVIEAPGEQSLDVNELLLDKVIDILIHNQKVIINKAISEAEEKMRAHLLKQIQELKGDKHTAPYMMVDKRLKRQIIIKEKFPLRRDITRQFQEILDFYKQSKWPNLRLRAQQANNTLVKIQKPLTLTYQEAKR